MSYKEKYLKYKNKNIELLSGGGIILPWFPMPSTQLYIEAVIDPASHLGGEIISRLGKIGIPTSGLHISVFELLVPEMRQNIGPVHGPKPPGLENPIDLYIKTNIHGILKNNIREIYNATLGNLVAYSDKNNYDCYGKFFVRKYDDVAYAANIIYQFRNFKIGLIHELLSKSFRSDFNTLILRPLVKLSSSSNPKRPPVITKHFTHYYQKGVINFLTSPLPQPRTGENISLFAISEYYDTPKIDRTGNLSGWIPHISITGDPRACQNIVAFQTIFKKMTTAPISYLTFWKSSTIKRIPINPPKDMYGSILKLIIKYGSITEEIYL